MATNGKVNQQISAEELAFCCDECGHGCYGGRAIKSWQYFQEHGVVTGGAYNTTDVIITFSIFKYVTLVHEILHRLSLMKIKVFQKPRFW